MLKLFVTGVALFWVSRRIDFSEVGRWIEESPLVLIGASFVAFNLSKIVSAFRLNLFFRADAIRLTELENLKLYYIGMVYNIFLPGGVGGDGYKVYYLNKSRGSSLRSVFKAVLWDRLSGVMALVFLSLVILFFLPAIQERQFALYGVAAVALVMFPLLFGVSNFLLPSYKSVFLSTNALALAVQVLQGGTAAVLLLSMGIPFEALPDYIVVFFISSLATVIPISIGGIGIREMVFLTAAQYSRVEQHQAVAFSVIFFAITAVSSLAGAFLTVPESDRVVTKA